MIAEKHSGTGKRLISLVFSGALIAIAIFVFFNRQALQDQIVLARYQPPAEIAALAEGANLSGRGKDLFYVNQPELHGEPTFNDVCHGLSDEQSNVLGCFTGHIIFIFNVEDQRLRGVREVTAAHEMLHAAYIRLTDNERQRVDKLLQQQLDSNVQPHVRELIDVYNRLEPGQLFNEMHSILATEQVELLPALEEYFGQYFENRRTIVALAGQYRDVFDSLKAQQEALAGEIEQLAEQINVSTSQINQQISSYNVAVENFNARARSGDISQEDFNQERPGLEAERQAIDTAQANNDSLRSLYEQKRQQFESLAIEFTELQGSIDSRPSAPEDVQ